MIAEHESVVLTRSLPEHGLESGDVGAVVHVYAGREAYEVEFVDGRGASIAVVTIDAAGVRPVEGGEILHVRSIPA